MEQLTRTPKEMYEFTTGVGEAKINKGDFKTFVGSVLAGIFISLGAIGYFNIVPHALDKGLGVFLGGVAFSIGLILVIVAGADLFTGNALTTIGLFRGKYGFVAVLRNWLLVLAGNIVGTVFMGFLVGSAHIYNDAELAYLEKVVHAKTEKEFMVLLASAILCNIIVALLVWMAYGCKTVADKVLMSVVGIVVFVVSGYEHVVANGFYFYSYMFSKFGFAGLFDGSLQAGFWYNLSVAAIGNIIGGGLVIAGLYHLYLKEK
jgi:formate/nitrite transporter